LNFNDLKVPISNFRIKFVVDKEVNVKKVNENGLSNKIVSLAKEIF